MLETGINTLSIGTNYAIINARANCTLTGKKYLHDTEIKTKKKDVILASEKERYLTIQDATLVYSKKDINGNEIGNIDKILSGLKGRNQPKNH